MEYRTVSASAESSFTEKKSEFIGYISPAETEEQATEFIAKIRALHRKATHNCYAYILRENNISRHSDDGEPGGTAGVPILEVLKKEGLTDVVCVVTRYFGGIMLGAGGLVRAYSNGASIAVKAAEIKLMRLADAVTVTVDYSLYGRLAAIFAEFDTKIISEDFTDSVAVTLKIGTDYTEALKAKLIDALNGNVDVKTAQSEYYNFG